MTVSTAQTPRSSEADSLYYLDPTTTRGRLLLAMAESVVEKTFGQTVVADVVRIAKVSRRTFYEHFNDREDCFLELCEASTSWIREAVATAASADLPWRDQVAAGVDVYLQTLTAQPRLTRSCLFEIYSTGERGATLHRSIHRRFAEQFHELAINTRARNPELNELSFGTASAVVAGILELVMLAIEDDTPDGMSAIRDQAIQLVSDVLTAPR